MYLYTEPEVGWSSVMYSCYISFQSSGFQVQCTIWSKNYEAHIPLIEIGFQKDLFLRQGENDTKRICERLWSRIDME